MDKSKSRKIAIGRRVKDELKNHKLNQKDLSEMIEVTTTTISNLVNGTKNVSSDVLDDVADALGITRTYLEVGDPKTMDEIYDLLRLLSEPERNFFKFCLKKYLDSQIEIVELDEVQIDQKE